MPGIDLLSLSLEELMDVPVTTATLFESDSLHAPANVSIVTAKDWQRAGARRTVDALSHLPATQILPIAYGYDAIAIRGYASTASTRGLATSLDGVRLNNFAFGTGQSNTANIELGILDHIELIRGPASAIHGSDAFHGVLALHAFESGQDQAQVSAETGERGFYHSAARYSGQASAPVRLNLALAASGQSDQERTYEYGADQHTDRAQRYQSRSLSLKFVSDPAQDLSWRWGVYADQFGSRDFPAAQPVIDSGQNTDSYFTRLVLVKKLPHTRTLELSGYYRDSAAERWARLPAPNPIVAVDNRLGESASGVALTWRQPRSDDQSTQWALSLGYDYAQLDEGNVRLGYGSGTALDGEIGGVGESRGITSAVLDADTRFADGRWGLSYGVRFDHYSDFGNEVSPRAGLIFLPAENTAVKLLYGHAFRAPTAGELYFVPLAGFGYSGNPHLSPETIDSLELVLIRQGNRWQGDLALFASRWQDAILLDLSSSSTGDYVNSGENRAEGIETTWSWRPDPWQMDCNASWTRSRNLNNDQDYRLFPRLILNLLLGRQLPAIDTRLTLAARYFSHADDVPDFIYNDPHPLDDYLRFDLNATRTFGKDLEGFIQLINLLNRDNHLPSVLGLENGIPDLPPTFSVGFRYGF